jgi:hypothetical protein
MKKYIHNHTGASIMTWIFVFLLLGASNAWAATYYTASNGNDNNPGTQGLPFRTIVKGMRTAQTPGDVLNVRAGTYNEVIDNVTVNPYPSGSPGNPITIRAMPGEIATIAGSGDHTFGLGIASHDLVFNGFIFDGENSFSTISIGDESQPESTFAHDVTFSNNEIRHSGGCGGGYHTVGLVSSNGSNCSVTGIRLTWRNNYIHTSWCGYGFYSGGHDNIWEGNIIENNAGFGIQLYDGYNFGGVNNNIIRNNIFRSNGFIRQFGAMTLWHGTGNLVYNNLILNNYDGISVGRNQSGLQVYNNTVVGNNNGIYTSYNTSLNTIIRGNIVWQSGDIHDGVPGVGTVQDHNLVGVNPLFVSSSDYHLQTGSPAINTGVCFSAVPTDYAGTTRTAPCEIGAYEFGGSPGGGVVTNLFVSAEPSNAASNTVLPDWTVQARDANNAVVTSYNGTLFIGLGTNPGAATLTGTTAGYFSNGIATWCCDLKINKIGVGYTFNVSAPSLPSVTTTGFTVTGTAPNIPTNVRATPIP